MQLREGTILQKGKYRIEKVLGQGSFGITYLATTKVKLGGNLGDMEAVVKVAVKEFFMRDLNGREGSTVTYSSRGELFDKYKKKFIKEAQNLSRLSHPNIIKVLDLFEANGTYYYVMKYCECGSLDERIRRSGGLSESETLRYSNQIGKALKYMHSKKMLHLDLKPGNVVLNDNGDAVLIDFGLSKQFDSNGEPESSTTIGLGTPGYAPIEQSNYDGKGFPVTMDVYAMGATLYKMLTGETPQTAPVLFNSGFPYEKLRERNVSEDLIAIISKAMKPMLLERCQSIEEFLKALEFKEVTEDEGTDIEIEVKPDPKPNPTPPPNPVPVPGTTSKPNPKKWLRMLMISISLIGVIVLMLIMKPIKYEGDYVDLGLSVKWGDCNIGADKTYEYGKYLKWRKAIRKQNSTWRLPTEAELEELKENCTWSWTTQVGKKGYKVTGPNGNSIFLPAAGFRYGTTLLTTVTTGKNGNYWSSTPSERDTGSAYILCFHSGSQLVYRDDRGYGLSVRPVSE